MNQFALETTKHGCDGRIDRVSISGLLAYQFLQERMLANYRYSHQGLSWYQKVGTSSDALHLFCSRQTGCKFDDEIPIKTQLYTTMCQTIGRRKTLWPTRLVRTCLAARDLCFIVYCGLGVLNNWESAFLPTRGRPSDTPIFLVSTIGRQTSKSA
jgi:hypothetical protein